MNTLLKTIFIVTFLILILSSIFGIFYLKRTVNYKLYYEKAVENTIRNMVIDNCLYDKLHSND